MSWIHLRSFFISFLIGSLSTLILCLIHTLTSTERKMKPNHRYDDSQPHFLRDKPIAPAIYILSLFALFYLCFAFLSLNQLNLAKKQTIPNPSPSSQGKQGTEEMHAPNRTRCNYSDGHWVRDERGPRYNGTSCGIIKQGQNCMANGRSNTSYLYWQWKPNGGCELPLFDPVAFLRLMENKHLAFIGDSLARNQIESLLCLLSMASLPDLIYRDEDESKFRRWLFPPYNATVSVFWSPFLVEGIERGPASGLSYNKMFMDSLDDRWVLELDQMDVVVFSAGHWFFQAAVYYEGNEVLGCHNCQEFNHTEIGFFDAFRRALRTALNEVGRRQKPSYVVVTTLSPAHFEGDWDKAGACPRTEPYKEGEKEMDYTTVEMRKIGMEEVEMLAKGSAERDRKVSFEVLDVTKMAEMRPDGHPGPYYSPNTFADGFKERHPNDCLHWCLPGPIDNWNEILLEMMKREKIQSGKN